MGDHTDGCLSGIRGRDSKGTSSRSRLRIRVEPEGILSRSSVRALVGKEMDHDKKARCQSRNVQNLGPGEEIPS